jgi:formylglycine-generating enzyme required for sulfatase activity
MRAAILAGLLGTPALQAGAPITEQQRAALQQREQAWEKLRQQAAQAEAKLRQAEREKTELASQLETEKQHAQQALEQLKAEQAQTKPDSALEQVAKELEKQNAEAERQGKRAEAEKLRLQAGLASAVDPLAASSPRKAGASAVSSAPTVASSTPHVGETIKDCAVCPELVVIPPGEFTMGSPAGEARREADEGPQHRVRIGYRLAVGKYEVTFAEWDACVAGGGCTYKPNDRGWGHGRRPVIDVDWDDIHQQYLPWLNRLAGLSGRPAEQQYRLLSEAEWEYAARAGSRTAFSFGDSINTDVANYNGDYSYNRSSKGRNRQQTVPVDSFAPNAFGLYNVHGNVWEWVEDCYRNSYQGAPNDGSAVQVSGCSRRVLRGGLWTSTPSGLRSAARTFGSPVYAYYSSIGFRLARMLP